MTSYPAPHDIIPGPEWHNPPLHDTAARSRHPQAPFSTNVAAVGFVHLAYRTCDRAVVLRSCGLYGLRTLMKHGHSSWCTQNGGASAALSRWRLRWRRLRATRAPASSTARAAATARSAPRTAPRRGRPVASRTVHAVFEEYHPSTGRPASWYWCSQGALLTGAGWGKLQGRPAAAARRRVKSSLPAWAAVLPGSPSSLRLAVR